MAVDKTSADTLNKKNLWKIYSYFQIFDFVRLTIFFRDLNLFADFYFSKPEVQRYLLCLCF